MAAHQAPPSLGFSRQEHWSGLPFPSPIHESEKWKWSRSVVSDSWRPHGLQPTRLFCPWDFPGKSTGVGCHCLLRFNVLAIVNSAAINFGVCVSFSIMFFSGHMPSSRIVGSYGSFIPSFLRKLHTVFNTVCITLHSYQQSKRVAFSLHPLQHLLLEIF